MQLSRFAISLLLVFSALGSPVSQVHAAPGCPGDIDCDGVADGADNCPATPNPTQSDLDGDLAGDPCDDEESTIAVARVTVWATGSKLGRTIFRGRLLTGVLGAADVLDASGGLRVTVRDADALDVDYTFDAADCVTFPSGTIRCLVPVEPLKKLRIVLRPKKVAGVPTGEWRLRGLLQGLDVDPGFAAPLEVRIATDDIDRVGSSSSCIDGGTRILCR